METAYVLIVSETGSEQHEIEKEVVGITKAHFKKIEDKEKELAKKLEEDFNELKKLKEEQKKLFDQLKEKHE